MRPEDQMKEINRLDGLAEDLVAANFRNNSSFRSSSEPWPEPEPLDSLAKPEPYPVDALPDTLRGAVQQYQAYGGQPVPLVASSALAVAAVAAQGLADVRIDEHRHSPLSLAFLVLAQSGERKTSADKVLAAPLEAFECEQRDALEGVIKASSGKLAAWEAEKQGIEAEIRRLAKKGGGEELSLQKNRMEQHMDEKPVVPTLPLLRYSDVTPEALALNLSKGWPSAALWSDEAGVFFGGRGMSKESMLASLAQINKLWEAGSVVQTRKVAESVYLAGRRLSVSLMVQPATLQDALSGSRGLARGTGFLARFLVAWPVSTMGHRPVFEEAPVMPALSAFHARVSSLLHDPLPLDDMGRLEPPTLSLSREARGLSADYAREVEAQLSSTGALHGVADFAAKSQEQAARLAGVLHVYLYGPSGEIGADTMERAIILARWHVGEALRVMGSLDEKPEVQHARLLDDYLAEHGRVRAGDVLRLGPYALRKSETRDAALDVLARAGRARQVMDGREKWIEPNPALRDFATAKAANLAKDEPNFRSFRNFRIRNDAEPTFSGTPESPSADDVSATIERVISGLPITTAELLAELAPEDMDDIRTGDMAAANIRALAQSIVDDRDKVTP